MRFCCISDTHNKLGFFPEPPEGDVLIHCGDMTGIGTEKEIISQLNILMGLKHKYKIFISGNHDILYESQPNVAKNILSLYPKEMIYLQDSSINLGSIKIHGTPWMPKYGHWAFMRERKSESLQRKRRAIPKTDILITHCPPYGILDFDDRYQYNIGCELLRMELPRINPKYHLFGHAHCGHGAERIGNTTFYNAAICDSKYKPSQQPIVFDYEG